MGARNGFRWQPNYNRLAIQVGGTDVAYFPGRGSNYTPHGKAFYVDRVNGSDTANGLSPDTAVAKIDTAVGLCTADADDYIFVISKGEGTNVEGATITFDIARVHVIGIGGPNLHPYCQLKAASGFHIFTVTGRYGEIANFRMSGGSTSYAGVYNNNATGTWVHHNDFGNKDAGTTPAYGILGGNAQINAYCVYEDNIFSGSGGTASAGTISVDGIYESGASRATVIRNNLFNQIPTSAIAMSGADGAFILDNRIMADATADAGAGISLTNCGGCLIDGNVCNFGKSTNTTKFFVDNQTINGWGWNTVNGALLQPT